jgi:HK97 family phage major capsid protein
MKINEMKQKRFKLVKDARVILDAAEKENRDLTAEETTKYEAMMTEVDSLGSKIEQEERVANLETELGKTDGEMDRGGADNVDEKRYAEAFRQVLAATDTRQYMRAIQNEALEHRALQMDVDTAGGYTVAPQVFVASLIKAMDNLVFMRQLANVLPPIPKAESLGAPSLDNDPADPTWTSELLIGDEDSTMTFGKRELFPHPLAQYIKLSKKLVRASALNIEEIVRSRLAYKASVVEENAFLNGTGVNQPLGVFVASANGIDTGRDVSTGNTVDTIKADNLIECKYTLKPGYWNRARWIFHRDAVKMIRKMKDGEGNYLWRAGLQGDRGDTILDVPIIMSEYVPNTFSTGRYVGIIGDFSNYWIADALSMDIQVLVELFAATNQNGYVLRKETDGMPVLEEAFVRVTLA